MHKKTAIDLLGGSITSLAEATGVSPQAISQWPDVLPRRLSDRVVAAIARKHLPSEVLGESDQPLLAVAISTAKVKRASTFGVSDGPTLGG